MKKSNIFTLLTFAYLIYSIATSIIAPFFPPYAQDRGLSKFFIGLIFSANPIGASISALLLGELVNEKTRLIFIFSGLFFQGIALFLFMVTKYVGILYIILLGILARFINGIGQSAFITSYFSYVPILFPEKIEFFMGFGETVGSFGLMVGPLLGSILFGFGGYIFPFLIFGIISILISIFFFSIFHQYAKPKKSLIQPVMKPSQDEEKLSNINEVSSDEHPKNNITYLQIIKHYPIIITTFLAFAMNFTFTFYNFLASLLLENQYDATPSTVGYYLFGPPLVYSITSISTAFIKQKKALTLFCGVTIIGISAFFIGPDTEFTRVPHNIYISIIAQIFLGFGAAFGVILQIPYLNNCILYYYPDNELKSANFSAALFTTGYAIGSFFGPIAAGLLTDKYGYDRAFSILGVSLLLVAACFFPLIFKDIERIQSSKLKIKQKNLKQNN